MSKKAREWIKSYVETGLAETEREAFVILASNRSAPSGEDLARILDADQLAKGPDGE